MSQSPHRHWTYPGRRTSLTGLSAVDEYRRDHLHLIPRSAPSFPLPPHGPVEVNSLGYAGMMLVRSTEEEEALLAAVEGEGGLMKVLERCGVPRAWGEKALETEAKQRGVYELN